MSETSQDDSTDTDAEELLRELARDKLYENINKEIAKLKWKIVEKTDSETGLTLHVLINEDGHPLWRINHADKGVAALAVDAFLSGAIQARGEAKEHYGELQEKLERWHPPPSGEFN